MDRIKNFFKDESGASAVEYGLLVALIAVVIITAITLLGQNLVGHLQLCGGRSGSRELITWGPAGGLPSPTRLLGRVLKELAGLAKLGFQGCQLLYQAFISLPIQFNFGYIRLPPNKFTLPQRRSGSQGGSRLRTRVGFGLINFWGKINKPPHPNR